MKRSVLFLLVCIWFLPYVSSAIPMVYTVDKDYNKVTGCNVKPNGDLSNCKWKVASKMKPNSIIISPNGKSAFISSELNVVFDCIRRESDGALYHCGVSESTSVFFNNPQGMVFDKHGHLYIANRDSGKITVCVVDADLGLLTDCKDASTGFAGPNSIAISIDGHYAYVTQPQDAAVAVCAIRNDFTFANAEHCQQIISHLYAKPNGVAANPDGRLIQIVDGAYANQGVSCELSASGSMFGNCISNNIKYSFNMPATAIAMVPAYSGSTNTAYSYIATQNQIILCKIIDGVYDCIPTVAQIYSYISSVAYTN